MKAFGRIRQELFYRF
jgi:hypothetical protein